jgi:tetratricopeptide (TPR) repeat protein
LRILAGVITLLCLAGGSFLLLRAGTAALYADSAELRTELREYEAALTAAQRSLEIAPGDFRSNRLYAASLYGLALEGEDKVVVRAFMEESRQAFLKAAELNPLEGNIWLDLALATRWLARLDNDPSQLREAKEYLERALKLDPNNGRYLYAMVSLELEGGEEDRGTEFIRRLGENIPDSYKGLRAHPNWNRAKTEAYMEGLERSRANPLIGRWALRELAHLAAEEGDWERAMGYVQEELAISGRNPHYWAFIMLGRYQYKLGRLEEAGESFIRGLGLAPDRVQALKEIFWYFQGDSFLDFFIDISSRAAEFDPFVRANLALIISRAFLESGDLDSAERTLHKRLEEKESAPARLYLAEIALIRQDWVSAAKEAMRAVELDPENSRGHFLLARALHEQNRLEAALGAVDKALKFSDGLEPYPFDLKGWLMWSLGRYEEAEKAWRRASNLRPGNPAYLRQLGMVLSKKGELDSARTYLKASLRLDPDHKETLALLKDVESRPKEGAEVVVTDQDSGLTAPEAKNLPTGD